MKKFAILFMIFLFLCSLASASTLYVGSSAKYHTIQSAVTAAHNGDTISVASGTYPEDVKIDKVLTLQGTDYPKVYGMYYYGGAGTIKGFNFQKYGINANYAGGPQLVRNNYFYNCGIYLAGGAASYGTIRNNKINNGTVYLYEIKDATLSGNTILNSVCGLYIDEMSSYPTVKNCIFKNNKYAVYFFQWEPHDPGRLTKFSGDIYSGNKHNFGWGSTPIYEL
jgi:parallel beta-helix repeat protein